jgi:hypothetical protein
MTIDGPSEVRQFVDSKKLNENDSIVKPLISDTMLLFEGYIFNIQMHVILDALSKLDLDEEEDIFKKGTRVEKYYKPRNRFWSNLQQLELQSEVKVKEVEDCEKDWNQIITFVDDYIMTAMKVYNKAVLNDNANQDARILTEHAKWNQK